MALTLRIEENPEAQKALELVKDTFNETSAIVIDRFKIDSNTGVIK